jgi:surface antigen
MTEVITKKVVVNEADQNRDPLSGTPGAHPLGTGAGATSGGAAGAVVGLAAGGPVGALVGVAVGALAGALAGKSAAEAVNPTEEEHYWRETYIHEPYYVSGRPYEYYAPGFRAGWEGRVRHSGRTFIEAEPELMREYQFSKSELDPTWDDMRPAAQAAWSRVDLGRL